MACSALIDKTNRNGLLSRMSFPGNFSVGMLGWQSGNFSWRGIVSSPRQPGLAGDAKGRIVGVPKASFLHLDSLTDWPPSVSIRRKGLGRTWYCLRPFCGHLVFRFPALSSQSLRRRYQILQVTRTIRDNPCENHGLLVAFWRYTK